MAEKKQKQYIVDNPVLIAEWNYEKNIDISPAKLTLGSNKKIWWKCPHGHEWQARIDSRNRGNGCPLCSGRYSVIGENDLQTINPELAREWNYEKNGELKPTDFTPKSGKKVWWKCSQGHEWQAKIDNRGNGNGCPYCFGKKVLVGYNDLKTINPTVSNEWNYEKNGDFLPEHFTANSGKKVWWKCAKGHEWEAIIGERNHGTGCPYCYSERNTSFPEYAISFYLEKSGLKTIQSYNAQGYELDIYVPSRKTAIEYDGYYWHKDKVQKDLEKNLKCQKDGIILYRIREGLSPLNDTSIDFVINKNQKDLPQAIKTIVLMLSNSDTDVDLKRDYIDIENLREHSEKSNSILISNPKISKEWNYEKNGSLRPENVFSKSKKMVWWKCDKGHEWQATVESRSRGNGCPYCAGRVVIIGETDLKTVNTVLASEWNYEKNLDLRPENVTANSGKKVWWKCSKGHAWEASICNRNRGSGCPYCSGRKKNDEV